MPRPNSGVTSWVKRVQLAHRLWCTPSAFEPEGAVFELSPASGALFVAVLLLGLYLLRRSHRFK